MVATSHKNVPNMLRRLDSSEQHGETLTDDIFPILVVGTVVEEGLPPAPTEEACWAEGGPRPHSGQ